MKMIEKLKHARRVSVPLVSLTTADQFATIKTVAKALNGDGTPVVAWDVLRGCWPVNEAGRQVVASVDQDSVTGNPTGMVKAAADLPAKTVLFMANMQEFLQAVDTPGPLQGIANLRDEFKQNGRMLIMLSPDLTIPPSIKDDVVVLDEELPDRDSLLEIVGEQDAAASDQSPSRRRMTKDEAEAAAEAVSGLNAFAAEQAVAMALRSGRDGEVIDLDHLWEGKRVQVEQTKGLSIHRKGGKFSDLGGLDQAKDLLSKLMKGRRRVRVVVWLDEVGTTGLANRSDTSGVNADAEGTLLSHMEDHNVYGVMLVGVPGCGKSQLCKCMAEEFGVPVVRLDLGAMQASLVGQSQQQLRSALKVVQAVGGDETMWIATSNSIDGLSAPMRSRYTDTLFFDSPTPDERKPIWQVWLKKLGLKDKPYAKDEGWVGRDIRHCCEKAWSMNVPIAEAAEFIIPASTVEKEEFDRQRAKADGRYLSASKPGVYRRPGAGLGSGKRSISTDG